MLPPAAAALLLMISAQNPATTPADRLSEDWWKQRHEQCQQMTKQGNFDLVFLGDSITQGWEGTKTWNREYAPLKAGNFGFSGDRTEHVLWRLEHGEIIGLQPKVIVIMIGTNNVGHGSSNPEQASQGIRMILDKLEKEVPKAKILLLGVFPRGGDTSDPMRIAVTQINDRIKAFGDEKRVFFRDIGKFFIHQDGTLRAAIMPDLLHLNEDGYEVWSKAIDRDLKSLMRS